MGSGGSKQLTTFGRKTSNDHPRDQAASSRNSTEYQTGSDQILDRYQGHPRRTKDSSLSTQNKMISGMDTSEELPTTSKDVEYESRWSDDGEVLTMIVAERQKNESQSMSNENEIHDSDSSLDDDIKEIERTVSVDSGLATSFMAVSMLTPINLLSSDDRETLTELASDAAKGGAAANHEVPPQVSKDHADLFSKRFQESVSSVPMMNTVRPCTSYGNANANAFRIQNKGPRRRSIAPLLAIERVKSVEKKSVHEEKEEDEWQYQQPEIEGFDLAKFKQANANFSPDAIKSNISLQL